MRLSRGSPVRFDASPQLKEPRGHWQVVLQYEGEGPGPWLVDLSHRRRWDAQHRDITEAKPFELEVPEEPGGVRVESGLAIGRMNRTQVSIWHLGQGAPAPSSDDPHVTEIGDGHASLAFVGPGIQTALEHLTELPLHPPGREPPFLTQGPLLHVPCQFITLGRHCVVLTCARGYGATLAQACLEGAAASGLSPAGEARFTGWFQNRFHRGTR